MHTSRDTDPIPLTTLPSVICPPPPLAAAIVFNPVPSPPAPPQPPTAPPSPPTPPAPPPMPPLAAGSTYQQGVSVTAFFYALQNIPSAASLQALMSSYSANLRANISMYTVTLPVTYPDFGVVANCTPAATAQFLKKLGAQLGLSPANMTCGCKLGGGSTTGRRRLSGATVSQHGREGA